MFTGGECRAHRFTALPIHTRNSICPSEVSSVPGLSGGGAYGAPSLQLPKKQAHLWQTWSSDELH